MKTKVSAEVTAAKVGSSSLEGKELVAHSVGMGHALYQYKFEPTKTYQLSSPFGVEYSHLYYFLSGRGDVQINNGTTMIAMQHTLLAMTGDVSAELSCQVSACVVAIYVPNQSPDAAKGRVTIRRLEDVVGTDRDVDWGNGRSRRFLVKSDEFNVAICNTWGYKNNTSQLEYKNHMESCCYYWGRGKYEWDGEKSCQPYDLMGKNGDVTGETVTMIMDQHDPHVMNIGDEDSNCISVFSPPLIGHERHSLDGSQTSSY